MGSSLLESIGRVQSWLCDYSCLILLGVLSFFPLWSTCFGGIVRGLTPEHLSAFPLLFNWLSNADAGAQLSLSPYFIRFCQLLIVALLGLFPRQTHPLPRPLWMGLTAFHLLSFLSAATSSHPYNALTTALDALLVTMTAVRIRELLATEHFGTWFLGFYLMQMVLIPTTVSDFIERAMPDGQMRGVFQHPNIFGTFVLTGLTTGLGAWALAASKVQSGQIHPRQRLVYWCLALGQACLVSELYFCGSRAALLVATILFCILLASLALGKSWQQNSVKPIVVGIIATSILLASFMLGRKFNLSLAVLAGVSATLLSLVLYQIQRSHRHHATGIAFCALLSIGTTFVITGQLKREVVTTQRISHITQQDSSVSARSAFWRAAWAEFLEHPGLGVGPNGFHRYYPAHQEDVRYFSKYAHNVPLATLAENGLPAFAALAIGLFYSIYWSMGKLKSDPPVAAVWRLTALANLAVLGLCSSLDVHWQFPYFQFLVAFQLGALWSEPADKLMVENNDALVESWTLRPHVVTNQTISMLMLCCIYINGRSAYAHFYSDLAKVALERKNPEAGLNMYAAAHLLNPFDGELSHQFGLVLLAQPDSAEVNKKDLLLQMAKSAVRWDSHRAVHYDLLSQAAQMAGQKDLATSAARTALEIDPCNFPSFYRHYSLLLADDNKLSEALSVAKVGVDRFPRTIFQDVFDFRRDSLIRQLSELYVAIGQLTDPASHPEEALSYFKMALELTPPMADARFGRAVCRYNQSLYAEAATELEDILKDQPDNLTLLTYIVNCYVGLNDIPRAKEARQRYDAAEAKLKAQQHPPDPK